MFSLLDLIGGLGLKAKAAIALVLVVASFGAGWFVCDKFWRAADQRAWEKYAEGLLGTITEMRKENERRREIDTAVVGKHQAKVAELERLNEQLREDLNNAIDENAGRGDITAGFVELWNARSQGRECLPGSGPDPSGAPCADRRATDLTLQDLGANHALTVERCLKWKSQLDRIIEWDSRQGAK